MNKRIDLTFNGGFPATQYTLSFMQESYRNCFRALAGLLGDKVIVSGCDVVGGQVTNGWISIGGELIEFIGGVLPGDPKVVISETPVSRVFDDGTTHDVYFVKSATIGTPGSFPFSDLKRLSVYSAFMDSLTNLINAFAVHTHSWASITGKPSNHYISYRGVYNVGDVNPADMVRTVTFPDQGTNDYHVIPSWVGNNSDWDSNNGVLTPNIFNKQSTFFQIGVMETFPDDQNIRLEYIIIKSL
jgi:hypothetical protein